MKFTRIVTVVLSLAGLACGEVPVVLKETVLSPSTAQQMTTLEGMAVATDGVRIVTGAPAADFQQRSEGVVHVYDSASKELLITLSNPKPGHHDQFGETVAISGTLVVVGCSKGSTRVVREGIVYVFDLSSPTPTVPIAVLNNPSPVFEAEFGHAIAISGTNVVVGTPKFAESQGRTESGIVYLYDLAGREPSVPRFVLENPSPALVARFGETVAISGDRVAVGAPGADRGSSLGGTVYLYDLAGSAPTLPSKILKNPLEAPKARFGVSLAMSGQRLAVGVQYDDSLSPRSGTVNLFDLESQTPEIPVLTVSGSADGGDLSFGQSIALSGTRMVVGSISGVSHAVYDVASASPTTPVSVLRRPSEAGAQWYGISISMADTQVVVGAPFYNGGSVLVFNVVDGNSTASVVKTLQAGAPSLEDNFGSATAMSASHMVVGAPNDDLGAENAGGAYIFPLELGRTTGSEVALSNPTPDEDDRFGSAVAISGRIAVIGAPYDDLGAPSAGTVYVYDAGGATPATPMVTLPNPTPALADHYGWAVAISGPLIVVGAPHDDAALQDAGAAYVYDLRSPTPHVPVVTLKSPAPSGGDNFGIAVAISGTRVVVGAYRATRGAKNCGTAYIFDLDRLDPSVPVLEIANPEPELGDDFGGAVSIDGHFMAISSLADDAGAPNAGAVYIYDLSGIEPAVPLSILHHPNPTVGAEFGAALAISNGKVLVGAPAQASGFIKPGIAYLYEINGSTSNVPTAVISNPDADQYDWFGAAVAMQGSAIVIGAYSEDTPTIDRGVVYLYEAVDVATDTPYLSHPLSYTSHRSPLPVVFTIFEPALSGSVSLTLTNGSMEWILSLSDDKGTVGTHELLLNTANPSATPGVVSATGGPLPDGPYTVTIAYADRLGNAPASARVSRVTIDNVPPTTGLPQLRANNIQSEWARIGDLVSLQITFSEPVKPPVITLAGKIVPVTGEQQRWLALLPVTPDTPEGLVSFAITYEDLAGNAGTPVISNGTTVQVDRTPPTLQVPASVEALAPGLSGGAVEFNVTLTDNLDPNAQLILSHLSGSVFPLGTTTVTAHARDAAGNSNSAQFDVNMRLRDSVKTGMFMKGEPVPGAGWPDSRLPAGARWASFGTPSLLGSDGYNAIAGFLARVSIPDGMINGVFSGPVAAPEALLLVGDAVTDRIGEPVEGATFKSFREPVFASADDFAVIATLKGIAVRPSNAGGIWAGSMGDIFEVARKGSPAPGIDGATFGAFSSVLMPAPDRVYFLASLKGRGVTRSNDSSLWFWTRSTGAQLVQREGAASLDLAVGQDVKSFLALHAVKGAAGHARYNEQFVSGLFTRKDKSQVVVTFEGAETAATDLETGFELMPGVSVKTVGFPCLLPGASGLSLRAILGSTDAGNRVADPAILRDGGIAARKGMPTPGVPDAVFKDFGDPVTGFGADGLRMDLFIGRIGGAHVRKNDDQGIWSYQGDDPALNLIAREGVEAPDCNGAIFKSFLSVSLMSGRGPLFTATLDGGSPRVKPGTDIGVWGTGSDGTLRLLLREGDEIGGRTLKHFDVLGVIPGSPAQQRAWAKAALNIVLTRCVFTDGTQGIVQVAIP